MRHFDASYDMNAAARRRNEILDATPMGPTSRDIELAARDRRYVELRMSGLDLDAAFDAVFAELSTDGMSKRNFAVPAYTREDDGDDTLDELRERVGR